MKIPHKYISTSGQIAMATTAADLVIFCLSNPAASGKMARLTKLQAVTGFGGTAAATRQQFALFRGTGTSAGGSGNKATSALGKINRGSPDSVCTLRYGPTAITGLTADGGGDMYGFFVSHQNAPGPQEVNLIDVKDWEKDRGLWLPANYSVAAITRVAASVAGEIVTFNAEWEESTG